MDLVKIELDDGKYTVLHNEEHGGVTVLRYGEPWRNETGDGFILAMIHRIQELEEEGKKPWAYVDENSVESMREKNEPYYKELAKLMWEE